MAGEVAALFLSELATGNAVQKAVGITTLPKMSTASDVALHDQAPLSLQILRFLLQWMHPLVSAWVQALWQALQAQVHLPQALVLLALAVAMVNNLVAPHQISMVCRLAWGRHRVDIHQWVA